jgi:hypothetical protein
MIDNTERNDPPKCYNCGCPTWALDKLGYCWDPGCDEASADAHRSDVEGEAEVRAEFAMSWVMGGGHPDDIGAAYSQHYGGF